MSGRLRRSPRAKRGRKRARPSGRARRSPKPKRGRKSSPPSTAGQDPPENKSKCAISHTIVKFEGMLKFLESGAFDEHEFGELLRALGDYLDQWDDLYSGARVSVRSSSNVSIEVPLTIEDIVYDADKLKAPVESRWESCAKLFWGPSPMNAIVSLCKCLNGALVCLEGVNGQLSDPDFFFGERSDPTDQVLSVIDRLEQCVLVDLKVA